MARRAARPGSRRARLRVRGGAPAGLPVRRRAPRLRGSGALALALRDLGRVRAVGRAAARLHRAASELQDRALARHDVRHARHVDLHDRVACGLALRARRQPLALDRLRRPEAVHPLLGSRPALRDGRDPGRSRERARPAEPPARPLVAVRDRGRAAQPDPGVPDPQPASRAAAPAHPDLPPRARDSRPGAAVSGRADEMGRPVRGGRTRARRRLPVPLGPALVRLPGPAAAHLLRGRRAGPPPADACVRRHHLRRSRRLAGAVARLRRRFRQPRPPGRRDYVCKEYARVDDTYWLAKSAAAKPPA